MAEITAQAVAQLREMTGLGLMQCKKALTETNGDLNAAVDHLRKQGAAVAAKRAGKEAKEGKVLLASNGKTAAAVEFNCETDFVANSGDFNVFANKALATTLEKRPNDAEALKALALDGTTVGEVQTAAIAKIGENIVLKRLAWVNVGDNEIAEIYSHMNGKIGVIIKLGYEGQTSNVDGLRTLAKDLTMQVAAAAPLAIDSKDIPADVVAKEREIAREVVAKEGKTGDMLERIVEGKVAKYFKENTLTGQVFIKDNKVTIDKLLAQTAKNLGLNSIRILAFHRLQLGQ
jgi:elongation factor Ts